MDLNCERFDMDFYNKNKSKRGELDFEKRSEDGTEIEISGSDMLSSIEQRESSFPYFSLEKSDII